MIRPLEESDLPAVASFVDRHRRSGRSMPYDHGYLRWLLLENPARTADTPLGWIVQGNVGGEIDGTMLCVPQRFIFRGRVVPALVSSSFYVDAGLRGAGALMFLTYRTLASRFLLLATTANASAGEVWRRCGGVPILNTNEEMLAVLNANAVGQAAVHRWIRMSGFTARAVASLATPFVNVFDGKRHRRPGRSLVKADAGSVLNISSVAPPESCTSLRDPSFIRWRYFHSAQSSTSVYAFRKAGSSESTAAVCVSVAQRGDAPALRVLNVIDMWGEIADNELPTVASLLAEWYQQQVDAIVFRCYTPEQRAVLASAGLVRRKFAAPVAYYIDGSASISPSAWALVPADGDMTL